MKTLNELTLLDKSSALPESISNQKGESLAYHMFYCRHCLRPVFYHFIDIQRIYLRFLSGMARHDSLFSAAWLVIPYSLFAQLPPSVRGILLAFVAIGILVFVGVEGMILRAATLDPASGLDYVIVLGAHVRSTGPTGLWLSGWMQPLDYAADNPDTIFIVSGGQGSNEPCTEADAMKTYLETHGLSSDRILTEETSPPTPGKT